MSAHNALNPKQNRILALLTGDDYSRLLPALEQVELTAGEVIYDIGQSVDFVYFPVSCIAIMICTNPSGDSLALGMTGKDGLVGIPLVLGGDTTPHRVIVQSSGTAFRLRAEIMRWELEQGGEMQRLALRHAQALMNQMGQINICSRHHAVEQQLSRWLLLSLDRLSGDQIRMTQENIANLLGVRREVVTDAAGKLQQAGLIRYSRGCITITDRPGLEARVCDCYAATRTAYERLLEPLNSPPEKLRTRPHPATLRMRAEARLNQETGATASHAPGHDTILRELKLRQIELEFHNEALAQSYADADSLRSRYADLYDFSPVGYCTVDAVGAILQINLAAAILLGVKHSQSRRHRFCDAVTEQSLATFKQFLHGVLQHQTEGACEITLKSIDQRPQAIVSIKAVADDSGHECRMAVIDITEQRRIESRLRESETLNMAVLNSITAHVAVIDHDGTVLAINEAWSNFARANGGPALAERSTGWNYRVACTSSTSSDGHTAWQGITQVLHGDAAHFQIDYPCDSPTEVRWFRMSVYPLAGHQRGAVVAHENITVQKHAELALRKREQYQRALLDSFPFMVWLKDEDSRFLSVNQPFADSFGISSTDSLVGKSDFDVAAPDLAHHYRADDRAVLDSGHSKLVEELVESDGRLRWHETYKSPVSLDGAVIGTVGYARVISGPSNAEQPTAPAPSHPSLKVLVIAGATAAATALLQQLHEIDLEAQRVNDDAAALELAQRHHYDLILIDADAPETPSEGLISRLRGLSGHRPCIVAMSNRASTTMQKQASDSKTGSDFDGYLSNPVDPVTLYATLFRCLARKSALA